MKIYEFNTWTASGLFSVEEIEVEEKPKSYVAKYTRILKSDINILSPNYGNRMYRLDNNPKEYIEAVIERKKRRVKLLESDLAGEKTRLSEWEAYLEKLKR